MNTLISMGSNENAWGCSPRVLAALSQCHDSLHHYPDTNYSDVKKALATFHSISPTQIVLGNGSDNIFELIVKAFAKSVNNAIVSQYAFLTIPTILSAHHIHIRTIPTNHWHDDLQAMTSAIDAETKLLFLVNPNNPTGTYTNKDSFDQFMRSVPSHVLVVVDEAYCQFIVKNDYPNTIDRLQQYKNLIVTRTFSKIYGLAGLRIGYSISSSDIAAKLEKIRLPYLINSLAAKAAIIALEDKDHIASSLRNTQRGLAQLREGLTKLGYAYLSTVTNFLTVKVGRSTWFTDTLKQHGILVKPLIDYGLDEYIRVTTGTFDQNKYFLSILDQLKPDIKC